MFTYTFNNFLKYCMYLVFLFLVEEMCVLFKTFTFILSICAFPFHFSITLVPNNLKLILYSFYHYLLHAKLVLELDLSTFLNNFILKIQRYRTLTYKTLILSKLNIFSDFILSFLNYVLQVQKDD